MIQLQDISYVRLGTRDLEGATRFATDILALEVAERTGRAVYFKSDEREHTLCYFEGDPTDHVVAFEIADRGDLDAAAATLERLGHEVARGSGQEARRARCATSSASATRPAIRSNSSGGPPIAGAITASATRA